jgi:hypothetical protein
MCDLLYDRVRRADLRSPWQSGLLPSLPHNIFCPCRYPFILPSSPFAKPCAATANCGYAHAAYRPTPNPI